MRTRQIAAAGVAAAVLVAGAAAAPGLWPLRAGAPAQAAQPAASREAAYRANNIGVARLEQYDFDAAAAAFQDALRLAPDLALARLNLALALFYGGKPDEARAAAEAAAGGLSSPHPHYLLGLIARVQDRPDDAVRAFRRALEIDPADVGTRVNLGQLYTQQRQYAEAAALLREAIAAEPANATAAYGLAMALTRAGDPEGPAAMRRFEALRGTPYARTYAQTYLEQGQYAEALASTGAEPDLVEAAPPAVTFADATPDSLRGRPSTDPAAAGSIVLADLDADGDLDLVEAGPGGLRLFRNAGGAFADATGAAGLSSAPPAPARAAVAGDFDNDNRPDLFVAEERGIRLLHQRADGRFEPVQGLPSSPPAVHSAAFVDVDHDGDLDIFMAGGAPPGRPGAPPNQLLRNNGNGSFADITAEAGVGGGGGTAAAVVPTDFDNRRDIDLLVARRDARPVLFQNVRDGSFRDAAEAAGLPSGGSPAVAAADVNKDGFQDFFFARADAAGVFALSDGRARFTAAPAPDATAGTIAAQFLDYDNDGLLDLIAVRPAGIAVLRNLGTRWMDLTARAVPAPAAEAPGFHAMASGDLDGDGDTDLVLRTSAGGLRLWRNDGGSRLGAIRVRLEAQQSNRTAAGARIDLRAGSLRQRLETSAAVPAVAPGDLLLGLGARPAADVVRLLWPSGTVQAELPPQGPARGPAAITVTELNRKPSSCPYLYTWNGDRFEFITDFMGGGEIGYWVAPGVHARPDPDEYVRIPAGRLQPRAGRYELRVTNELEEALFVDRLQLVAVDHPAGTEVFPNEGLKGHPPSPFTLTTVRSPAPPLSAVDGHGHDVRARIAALDRTYPDDFRLIRPRGYAEPHSLTLDLGPGANRSVLLMTGWTDYAFSSDNVAGFQQGLSLRPPALEARDESGAWRPIAVEIGIPVGRPQTVVVDLRGRLPRGREVRISTNMRIYWDQILVDTPDAAATRVTRANPAAADLRWRGFSAQSTPDGREPYGFDYTRVSAVSTWKVLPGRYTREGDVRPLLRQTDDMFVVSRPGDEIALSFDQAAFPPLKPGDTRTFLLYADGFSKEMDINSASPHATDPLPFHAMTRYPYSSPERYPDTVRHRDYLSRYNTRIVRSDLPAIETAAP